MSHVIRKPAFCIYENKGTYQLCGNRTADLRHSKNFKPPAIFCGCTAQFVSDLVGNPKDRFSCEAAHLSYDTSVIQRISSCCKYCMTTNITTLWRAHVSRDARKPVFGVSDQVPQKPGSTTTQDG